MKDTGCRMTKAELAKYGVIYLFLDLAVSALFYRSWIAFLAFLPGMYWFLKEMGKRLEKKRRERLEQGFLMGMRYVSTALSAGYSIEHAFEQALVEMKKVCRTDDPALREFGRIVGGLKINQTMEALLLDLAERSDIEDIQIFAEVFEAARRTGGDLIAIIRSTTMSIARKEETRQEIAVCLASKKMEQSIMSVVPFLLIGYVQLVSPGFLDVMYGNPAGVLIMSACLGTWGFAFWLGRKIVSIEI